MSGYTKRTPAELAASYKARGAKISAALKARYAVTPPPPIPAETRKRINEKLTGRKRTPAQIKRLRAAKRAYWAANKLPDDVRRERNRVNRAASQKRCKRASKARCMGAPPGAERQSHCDACGIDGCFERGRKNHHLDHCHRTGRFRGVLCAFCNTTLGRAEARPERFALLGGGLLAYARRHGCAP